MREAAFDQYFKCPEALACNGVAWRTINPRRGAASVFDRMEGMQRVFPELPWGEPVYEVVPVAMAADLVPSALNRTHELRVSVGNPAQDEERTLYVPPLEQLE